MEAKNLLQKLIQSNNLAHGYVFFGAEQKVQSGFAQWLVNYLEKEPKHLLDCLQIGPVGNSVAIDQVRVIKSFLWQKPIQSLKRTVIIHSANYLTLEAQNAILKIAEEPPDHALIILLVGDPKSLIGTLLSRLQKIYLSLTALAKEGLLVKNGVSGSMMSAQRYASDFLVGNHPRQKQVIKDLLEQESQMGNDELLSDFVRFLMLELNRNQLKNWRILKELLYRWRLINQFNVNKRLQLEAVAMALSGV